MTMSTRRACLALTVAGLALVLPAGSARAQSSYGYDSFLYGAPPAQSFWAGPAYPSMYTDPSTGVFSANSVAPYRGVAPYNEPPFGMIDRGANLPPITRQAPAAQAPARAQVVQPQPRRGLLRRVVRRR